MNTSQPIKNSPIPIKKDKSSSTPAEQIKGRRTEELVFAFCGALGSGISTVADMLTEVMKDYGYSIHYSKKLSNFIEDLADTVKDSVDTKIKAETEDLKEDEAKRIFRAQTIGNELRRKYGNDILALLAVSDIANERHRYNKNSKEEKLVRESCRIVHIVDSLKHPEEVALLRAVYGNMFYLFGILCAEASRKSRLKRNKRILTDADKLMDRDMSEELEYGQKLKETLQHADFFLRNNHENVQSLKPAVKRYIKLLLGYPNITPTKHEYGMYMAQSAAVRSGCLSRQVGAAIMNSEGDIISTGCNDVPKAGGGLYSTEMGDNDLRCMNRYNGQCWAVFHKDIIRDQIEKLLRRELGDNDKSHEIAELISKNTRLKNILEFSRSVHAEMDAIVSVARNGKASLKGCTLFCTTFPCHNCARHIIASGIMEVYYIEPYEKSLAWDLHDDSMVLEPTENDKPNNKVVFSHFEGVAPRKYLELFRYVDEKKEGGKMVRAPRRDHLPRIAKYLDPFPDYESRVVHHLTEIGLIKGEGDDNGEQK